MSERYRFRCGHLSALRARGPWADVEPKRLPISRRTADIHLNASNLTRALVGNLDGFVWDLLDLAAYVYVADQMVCRGGRKEFEYGQKWRRHFRFEVAVRDPERWNRPEVLDALVETLTFLSDDDFEFAFLESTKAPVVEDYFFEDWDDPLAHTYRETVLFSGGVDSLCGAVLETFISGRRLGLVSHWACSKVLARQRELLRVIREQSDLGPSLRPLHITVSLNKKKQLTRDYDQRCRSFVFASLGAIVAGGLGLDGFRVCENGITSLNLPISPQIVGPGRAGRSTPRPWPGSSACSPRCGDGRFAWKTPTNS